MAALSYSRGHQIYFHAQDNTWRYCDTNEIVNHKRACKRCGCLPTQEGHDQCLGKIDGAKSACCGHGTEPGYIVTEDQNITADVKSFLEDKIGFSAPIFCDQEG